MSQRMPDHELAATGLDACFAMVRDFQEAIEDPAPRTPTQVHVARMTKRIKWMRGELSELENASTMVQQVDALCDLVYFVLGTFAEMGVPPGRAFLEVHSANMRKTNSGDGAILGPEGRLQKPLGWEGPEDKIARYLSALQED